MGLESLNSEYSESVGIMVIFTMKRRTTKT